MSEYFPDFPDPSNDDYYHRSDIEEWAKRHRICWDMLNSQIDNIVELREQGIIRINELTKALKKAEEGNHDITGEISK